MCIYRRYAGTNFWLRQLNNREYISGWKNLSAFIIGKMEVIQNENNYADSNGKTHK